MGISKEHGNWLTVCELIRSIREPISMYADEIVRAFHEKLCKDFLPVGKCASPENCNKKTKPNDLCKSCKWWFKQLKDSHEKGKWCKNWHKNCKSTECSEDHWEVAKFFMREFESNLSTVKDAESTDLSSLLNVLEWMKDGAFLGKTRVNVNLVRKLRSQVRNTWAHAPQLELTDDETAEGFSIATDFLEDLEKVWSNAESRKCLEYLKNLKTIGVSNVIESERQSLLLLQRHLRNCKDEITEMKAELSSDKSTIEEHEEKLKNLERAINECSQRINSMKERQKEERKLKSCLPDKLSMFTAREAEIKRVITSLKDERKAIVCLYGGPGFGKTSIAIEVSHKLDEDDNILVVFSQLTTATTIDEMIRQLCLDVGVNNEDDRKSSLIFRLKNVKENVILVMDNIDTLLEEETRSDLNSLISLLRKNCDCQIITTSRSSYLIPDLPVDTVDVGEMDKNACIELLRKQCPEQNDTFLQKLAELCGNIPLAMCIASSLVDDFEDSDELLQHLQEQPMKTLECPESDQYVYRAINMSYEKCSDEEKETLVRLVVFEGSFSEDAAKAVIEKENLHSTRVLKKLVRRSLIKKPTKHRYSIHLLIKHFLKDQQKGENEIAGRAREAATRAKLLMVKYYLKLGHNLTRQSYFKDEYKANREALKQEAHNIQNVLKICCQQKDPTTSDISDCLAHSEVFTTLARFFSLFVRTIIPGSIVDEFLVRCTDLAKERDDHAIKINFDCLLAEQERNKSTPSSDQDFSTKMEEIEKEFETHKEDLKQDKSLCAHYYYLYGVHQQRRIKGVEDEKKRSRRLEKSMEDIREKLTDTPEGTADKVYSLLNLGHVCKAISSIQKDLGKRNECETSLGNAEKYYKDAIKLSKNDLGQHELTSSCYKSLGDLFLKMDNSEEAKEKYNIAIEMREYLGLEASERHVLLLNSLGVSFTKSGSYHKAIQRLEIAREMAENLAENNEPNKCKAKVYTTLAIAHHSVEEYSEDAVKYAQKAKEFDGLHNVITESQEETLNEILPRNAGK